VLMILLMIWLLPKAWRTGRRVAGRLSGWLSAPKSRGAPR